MQSQKLSSHVQLCPSNSSDIDWKSNGMNKRKGQCPSPTLMQIYNLTYTDLALILPPKDQMVKVPCLFLVALYFPVGSH